MTTAICDTSAFAVCGEAVNNCRYDLLKTCLPERQICAVRLGCAGDDYPGGTFGGKLSSPNNGSAGWLYDIITCKVHAINAEQRVGCNGTASTPRVCGRSIAVVGGSESSIRHGPQGLTGSVYAVTDCDAQLSLKYTTAMPGLRIIAAQSNSTADTRDGVVLNEVVGAGNGKQSTICLGLPGGRTWSNEFTTIVLVSVDSDMQYGWARLQSCFPTQKNDCDLEAFNASESSECARAPGQSASGDEYLARIAANGGISSATTTSSACALALIMSIAFTLALVASW